MENNNNNNNNNNNTEDIINDNHEQQDDQLITIPIKCNPSPFWGFYIGFKNHYDRYQHVLDGVMTKQEFDDLIESLNSHKMSKSARAKVISAIIGSRGAYNPTRKIFYGKIEKVFDVIEYYKPTFQPRNIHLKLVQLENKKCLIEMTFKPAHDQTNSQYKPTYKKEYDPYPLKTANYMIGVIVTCTLVDIFKVSPIDPLPIQFRIPRFINWFLLALGYSAIYIGRYNFTLLTDDRISNDINLSSSSYGWILSIGYWTYALFAPFTGSFGDYFGSKYSVVIGTMGSGIVNVLLGVIILVGGAHSIPPTLLFGFFNAINFVLQSLSTGSVNKINSGWYRKSDLGLFGGIFSSVLATAFFFTLSVGTTIVNSPLHWGFLFILPGAFLIICAIGIWFRVKEKPYQAGWKYDFTTSSLPLVLKEEGEDEEKEGEEGEKNQIKGEQAVSSAIIINSYSTTTHEEELDQLDSDGGGGILLSNIQKDGAMEEVDLDETRHNVQLREKRSFKQVLKTITKEVLQKENIEQVFSRDNILNALCLFCCGWIKEGFISWFIPFLKFKFPDASNSLISISSAGVTVGATLGGIICGLLSDHVFNSKRPPALFIFFLLMNICIVILYFITNQVGAVLILYLTLVLILGANNVLAVTALLDLGVTRNASLMAGLLTSCQYTASGFSGFLLGYIVDHLGFSWWMISMLPFGIAAMIMMGYNGIGDFKKRNK
ncbi:hypothetical protein DFA_01291 [Cavenderia fasciculata]|uniref:Major facilitator superfamily (MFS) profile domain-containing protein n=1 Tax=Cavenderia fasciculata TaxID=261658 RepID=F4PRX1_CACFS|nr:uncharacterized protein DFA_01291 [Cavenderia fasciculata]EGG21407.1 hypothetical protein DFA_01291 [Cavenderia fasciculata]|eukprot:XP_004359257.1 hypothetical protein DFA_01291 [Cavenderia fasciculata]